jgi:hypothetical protein
MGEELSFATKIINRLTVYEFLSECSNEELQMLKLFISEHEENKSMTDED